MAPETDHTSPQHSSPLLSLPPEMRNNIYRLVLKTEDEHIEIEPSHIRKHTTILQTGRQIRSEANMIFYAENTFHTTLANEKADNLVTWLGSVGKANTKLLVKVVIAVDITSVKEDLVSEVENVFRTQDRERALAFFRRRSGRPMVALAKDILATGSGPESFKVVCELTKDQEDDTYVKLLKSVGNYQPPVLTAAMDYLDKKAALLTR